ncbi:ANKRD44, partial [Symbiodinium microadriaticum]
SCWFRSFSAPDPPVQPTLVEFVEDSACRRYVDGLLQKAASTFSMQSTELEDADDQRALNSSGDPISPPSFGSAGHPEASHSGPMSCCSWKNTPTPLELYAMSLPEDVGAPMLFPMYTVAVEALLKMTEILPHEELKAQGKLTIFEAGATQRAAFVSHQWVAIDHPDPEFRQMRILQDALQEMIGRLKSVPLDFVTETLVPSAAPLPLEDVKSCSVFVWYDYFSCPQLERRKSWSSDQSDGSQQANAINSIPAYVANCQLFLALCPVLDCPCDSKVLTSTTWRQRGWCRVERAARELSTDSTWILIQSSSSIELVGAVLSFPTGSVGEGEFTKEGDRKKLAPVMQSIVMRKLMHCLRARDFPGFRRYFNLQNVHLRGLEVEPVRLLPSDREGPLDAVSTFLRQNGLRSPTKSDRAGWFPLHYAALSGSVEVLQGLLETRASVNQRTSRDEPLLGFPLWTSALDLAVSYKHHDAARWLIGARAHLEGGLIPALSAAALSNNPEGIRLLCAAGGQPLPRNRFGQSALDAAAAYGAEEALEEIVAQGQPGPLELSMALFMAAKFRGGSAEMVRRLIYLRADVDFQLDMSRDFTLLGRLLFGAKAVQYRLGQVTVLSSVCYHLHGSTPLMQAVRSAQYDAAAALIAAGAKLKLRNCRNWTVADFARGHCMPRFLQQGFEETCQRQGVLASTG